MPSSREELVNHNRLPPCLYLWILAGLHRAPLCSVSLASAPFGSDLPGSAPLGSTRLDSASGRAGSGRAYWIGPSLYPLLDVDPVRGPDSERGDPVSVSA